VITIVIIVPKIIYFKGVLKEAGEFFESKSVSKNQKWTKINVQKWKREGFS